jgi:hypothetical protein
MLGIVALRDSGPAQFVLWVVVATTFHRSAVLLLPVAALASTRHRIWTATWVGVVGFAVYGLLLEESVEALYYGYIERQYESQGALIRLAMNALPAIVLLIWRRRFRFGERDARLWQWFAIISLALIGVVLLTPATAAVDRVALYLLPLQIVVFSNLPDALAPTRGRTVLAAAVLLYYATVQFVWLNYASHAFAWLPYRFYPLEAWF